MSTENDIFDDAELEGLSPSRRKMLLSKRAKQGAGAGAPQKTVAPKASAQKPATKAARTTTKEVDSHPFVTGTAVPEVFDIPRGTITVEPIDRRSFIPWLGIGWTAFAMATGAFLTMLGRFYFRMYYLNLHNPLRLVFQVIILSVQLMKGGKKCMEFGLAELMNTSMHCQLRVHTWVVLPIG